MLELRQQSFDPVDGIDDVGLRLLPDDEQHCRLLVETCRRETIARGENNFSDVADAHDVAVRQVLDDNVLVVFRVGHLQIGLENDRLSCPVDRSDRREIVGSGDSDPDVFEADAHLGNQRRIDLDAGGRLVGAADRYVRNAIDLRNSLTDHSIGSVVDVARRHRLRRQGKYEYRRTRRIIFAKRRNLRQVTRDVGHRGV